jgi:hypothetical protein
MPWTRFCQNQMMFNVVDLTGCSILGVVMRRQSEDPTAIAFRTALNNLRPEAPTIEDWKLLSP